MSLSMPNAALDVYEVLRCCSCAAAMLRCCGAVVQSIGMWEHVVELMIMLGRRTKVLPQCCCAAAALPC